jgi:hypothetical protein
VESELAVESVDCGESALFISSGACVMSDNVSSSCILCSSIEITRSRRFNSTSSVSTFDSITASMNFDISSSCFSIIKLIETADVKMITVFEEIFTRHYSDDLNGIGSIGPSDQFYS